MEDFDINHSGSISILNLIRRNSLEVFQGANGIPDPSFKWNAHNNHWFIEQTDGIRLYLFHTTQKRTFMKNFALEVRALRDVGNMVQEASVLLDSETALISDLIEQFGGLMLGSLYESCSTELITGIFGDATSTQLNNMLQGVHESGTATSAFDQSWLCTFCTITQLKDRRIGFARLRNPTNFAENAQHVRFFILILCPSVDKGTKSCLETARTFGTLFSIPDLRQDLLIAQSEEEFKGVLKDWGQRLYSSAQIPASLQIKSIGSPDPKPENGGSIVSFGRGLKEDFFRRLQHYVSDYKDGISDSRGIQKTIATSVFLYFACLLPTIAFGTLNDSTTHGVIDVRKGIFAQTVGQLFFGLFGGQHLNILLTTAPLCLFVKIIHGLAEYFDIVEEFPAFYCCVGLWCSLFLFLSAFVFDLTKVMRWCTRSTEEIFALFIAIAFVVYAVKDVSHDFEVNYNSAACELHNPQKPQKDRSQLHINKSDTSRLSTTLYSTEGITNGECHQDTSLLFLFLMFGTFWFGFRLFNFKDSPFLQATKREILSDYALPIAVLVFSFIGSYLFQRVPVAQFPYDSSSALLKFANLQHLTWTIIICSAGLGFSLAVLIFMDQNIGAAIVNNPSNQLKKGPAYHWDLVIVALINAVCSIFTLPWLHVALPHAPMHIQHLADLEERIEFGLVRQIVVRVRETRLTSILSHILMGLSLLLLPYPLAYIPNSVFDGLYLFMGITSLGGNQMFERVLLIFTEQTSYPPNHYIRHVPQRKIHLFTFAQILQLVLLCVLGFFPIPFVKVAFPFVLLLLMIIRHKVLPRYIEHKYLNILD